MPNFDFILHTADNLKLQGRGWAPDTEIKAAVCLVHGLGEHCGRYEHVAKAFNQAGYALLGCDLHGHGRSEGRRGHVPNYSLLTDDISQLLEMEKQRYPDRPIFLYGHSLGGNLVIHYVLRNRPELAGVIATAPLFKLAYEPPAWQTILLRLLNALRINVSIPSGMDDTALSRDMNVIHAYRNDPLTHNRITPQLAVNMIQNGEWNLEHAAEFISPLLLMHGDADRITSAKATQEFASQAHDCTLKLWDGFSHELHNDPGKEDVLIFMIQWMDSVCSK